MNIYSRNGDSGINICAQWKKELLKNQKQKLQIKKDSNWGWSIGVSNKASALHVADLLWTLVWSLSIPYGPPTQEWFLSASPGMTPGVSLVVAQGAREKKEEKKAVNIDIDDRETGKKSLSCIGLATGELIYLRSI